MKRYNIRKCEIKPVTKITFSFEGNDITDKKNYTLYVGDCVSFIYTDNMEDVGKNDKIVRGRIVDIIKKPRYNIRQRTPNFNTKPQKIENLYIDTHEHDDFDMIILCVDESTKHNSVINQYPISKILDINDADYEYLADDLSTVDTSLGLNISDKIEETSAAEHIYITKDYSNTSTVDNKDSEYTDTKPIK